MANIKVLRVDDLESILAYERKCLEQQIPEAVERELASWHAPWRREALEHFLPLGWSFAIWEKEYSGLMGYVLAQPLLFFNGFTQSLWVERLGFSNEDVARQLVDVVGKTCKEKHFQKIIFNDYSEFEFALDSNKIKRFSANSMEMPTAKY